MMPLTAQEIAAATGGTLRPGTDRAEPFVAVFTDTRKPVEGALFIALVGERFDAHGFVDKAVAGGAAGIVVNRSANVSAEGVAIIEVDDTAAALIDLGKEVRRRHPGAFIAITGSVGKTTVKDMVRVGLQPFGKVGSTIGNYNNAIGVPLSLFALDGDEKFVVLEVGMNAAGEIRQLTEIVQPHVGCVTAAVAAHLEFFDSVDAIADAKAELFEAMTAPAVAVANADDHRVVERAVRLSPGKLLTYARHTGADVTVQDVAQTAQGLTYTLVLHGADGPLEVGGLQLRGLGAHNAGNAAAAATIVRALNMTPQGEVPAEALAAMAIGREWGPGKHRLQPVQGADGVVILDDCYNANPASTMAAIDALRAVAWDAPARCAVLGSMLELGPTAPGLHYEVGAYAVREAGCMHVYSTGPYAEDLARGAANAGARKVIPVQDAMELADAVKAFAGPKRWILLKGSRGQRLERLLPVLGANSDNVSNGGAAA